MIEAFVASPAVAVDPTEYNRLLGYPRHHPLTDRAQELAAQARAWYAEHGRPWLYLREVPLALEAAGLRLDGVEFGSALLAKHLRQAAATRAVLVAASAGVELDEGANALWREGKPDEYFFLEMFGSAVVEHLVSTLSGWICAQAEAEGMMAIPHYSPGYAGWDVAEQPRLFELVARGAKSPLPARLEVLASGMLRPKKSLLGVFGLTARTPEGLATRPLVPCHNCAFAPCAYRRAPYRHAGEPAASAAVAAEPKAAVASSHYTVGRRALEKWARERVEFQHGAHGTIEARFRFDGTTCANLGRPLAFDYVVQLAPASDAQLRIVAAHCTPATGDTGYQSMCAYREDATALERAIAADTPPVGESLDAALARAVETRSTGCLCDPPSRAHKWRLALETIHFALAARDAAAPVTPTATLPSIPSHR